MSGMDDPREILKAAGVECRELTLYMHLLEDEAAGDDSEEDEGPYAIDVYVALARLVATQAEELKKSETFIALLKGMVEQQEDDDFEGEYDLEDLLKRIDESRK